MNIQKVFQAVISDEMNSPLPLIAYELRNQGYKVQIEGLEIAAEDIEGKLLDDLVRATNEINIEIIKDNTTQQFKIVFTDYHKFNFQSR